MVFAADREPLGAAGLAVRDLALAGATKAAGVSESGQPAAARMVDSLVAADLVRRAPGSGRSVAVRLTPGGRRTVRRLLDYQRGSLSSLVGDALDSKEQVAFAGLLEKILARAYAEVGDSELVCRLCDRGSCTTNAVCPVGEAERRQGR